MSFYVRFQLSISMATGGDPSVPSEEMEIEAEQASLEQSSGVIQFRTPEDARRVIEEESREMAQQRHSTPQNDCRGDGPLGQNDDGGRRDEQRPHRPVQDYFGEGMSWGNDQTHQLRDEYHGDVRPRMYRIQGGGDRPQLPRSGENVRSNDNYRPQFRRAYNPMAGDCENDRMREVGFHPRNDRINRPLIKPERYDGSEDWSTYIQHFEWCADLNGWTDQEKAKFLTVSVTGTARQVLAGVSRDRLAEYRTVVQILKARFDPIGRMELHRIQLKNRVRQQGESLSTLADDVRRLVDKVFQDIPSEARDKLARDCFIDALTDGEMRTRILQMRTTSIQEAMEAAIELEALSRAERERGPKRVRELGGCQNPEGPALVKELKDEIQQLKRQLTEQRPRANNTQQRRCYNCGDPSHFARECPKPRKPFTRDGTQGGN